MPEFVLNRTHCIRSLTGRIINFEKGVPVYVPPEVVKEALEIGAEPVEAVGFDRTTALLGDQKERPQAPLTAAERSELLAEAFAELEASNARADFTGSGLPHVKAIERVAGFAPDARERDAAWYAYKEAKVAAASV